MRYSNLFKYASASRAHTVIKLKLWKFQADGKYCVGLVFLEAGALKIISDSGVAMAERQL